MLKKKKKKVYQTKLSHVSFLNYYIIIFFLIYYVGAEAQNSCVLGFGVMRAQIDKC